MSRIGAQPIYREATIIPGSYDLAIATIGYEDRSSYFWRTVHPLAASSFAFGTPEHEVLSFKKNLAFYKNSASPSIGRMGRGPALPLISLLASAPDQDVTRW